MCRSADRLKSQRREFIKKSFTINSPKRLFDFQASIAEEIKNCERLQKTQRVEERSWHMHLLRYICDSLAWHMLYPHSIRQLARNTGRPPYLIDQGEAFDATMECAEILTKRGVPALVSDLTNCLRICDIVVPIPPDNPRLIECKASSSQKEIYLLGRRGKQLLRMKEISNYLAKGRDKLIGVEKELVAINPGIEPRYNWRILNKLCKEALKTGFAFKFISENELIISTTDISDKTEHRFEAVVQSRPFKSKKCFLAVHMVAIEEAWPFVSPPLNWELSPEVKIALFEGDVILVHLFNPDCLLGYTTEKAKIVAIDSSLDELDKQGYSIQIENQIIVATHNFTNSVLYNYEIVESVAQRMITTALKSIDVTI